MSYQSTSPGWYQMHSPDSILSAGGKDWSSAPWVDWGDNPNTAGPSRIAIDGESVTDGTNAVLPQYIQISNEIRAFVANNKLLTAAILASIAAGAGYWAYSYVERK